MRGDTEGDVQDAREGADARAGELKERNVQGRHHWRAYLCVYCGGYHLTRQPPRS